MELLCGRAGGGGLGGVRLGLPQPGHRIDNGHQVAGQRARVAHAVAIRALRNKLRDYTARGVAVPPPAASAA